jgi:alpha-beta hydrolase superfamily lysophospholipase
MNSLLDPEKTIKKTLMVAQMFDGFWERWLAHGIEPAALDAVRGQLQGVAKWEGCWNSAAAENERLAEHFRQRGLYKEAEHMYRLAGLYYNLIHWIYPNRGQQKSESFARCRNVVRYADELCSVAARYDCLDADGHICYGRLRIPERPRGCVVIVNPLDSSKEELFTYETDFLDAGFVTVSFDGPGQGETFVMNGRKATQLSWRTFIDNVIDYAGRIFNDQPIYLFGTSSGGAWAVYGSSSPKVSKAVSVSPAMPYESSRLPDYFVERMHFVVERHESILPDLEPLAPPVLQAPVLLFHGEQDVMVSTKDVRRLFDRLPSHSRLIEYPEEGHCCNRKLKQIRRQAAAWFSSERRNRHDSG